MPLVIQKARKHRFKSAPLVIEEAPQWWRNQSVQFTLQKQFKTEIRTNKILGFEVVDQELKRTDAGKKDSFDQEHFHWDKIFVTAYGAGLRTEGTEDYGQYFAADAVYSLFKYSWRGGKNRP